MKITNIFLHNILKLSNILKKYKNEAYVGKIQVSIIHITYVRSRSRVRQFSTLIYVT